MGFEISILALAFIVFLYNFCRMRKIQRKILTDWADPNSYCSDEYLAAFTQAFERRGLHMNRDVYKKNQTSRSVVNG